MPRSTICPHVTSSLFLSPLVCNPKAMLGAISFLILSLCTTVSLCSPFPCFFFFSKHDIQFCLYLNKMYDFYVFLKFRDFPLCIYTTTSLSFEHLSYFHILTTEHRCLHEFVCVFVFIIGNDRRLGSPRIGKQNRADQD